MERSAFLYLEPGGDPKGFANCSTCKMFLKEHNLCSLHGRGVKITGDMSCGLYVPGGPAQESEMEHISASVTPKESGLIKGHVKCHHCEYFEDKDNDCLLFKTLNIKPHKVDRDGCCNAFEPSDHEEKESKSSNLKKFTR